MNRLIGFSGAHCTGKSATIEHLKTKNVLGLHIDEFKVSRTVLAEMNTTLEEATKTPGSTKEYQNRVLQYKLQHDAHSLKGRSCEPNTTFLVDRTAADVYAYARLWALKTGDTSDWISWYERQCISVLQLYDLVYLFPPGKFDFIDDGVRAKAADQVKISEFIHEFISEHARNFHIIESTTIADRAIEVLDFESRRKQRIL